MSGPVAYAKFEEPSVTPSFYMDSGDHILWDNMSTARANEPARTMAVSTRRRRRLGAEG
jgi:hypothetical protein